MMSTTGSIIPYEFTILRKGISSSVILQLKSRSLSFTNQRLLFISGDLGLKNGGKTKMDMAIYSGVEPGPALPSDPSPGSWKFWIVGMLVSVVLPFWRNKWWPLQQLKNEVETVVETAEQITDIVETVAEEVEKVAEEVADNLPDGGKFKQVVTFVENVAEETVKNAHLAGEFIDKVEEVEKLVEELVEPVMDEDNKITKKAE